MWINNIRRYSSSGLLFVMILGLLSCSVPNLYYNWEEQLNKDLRFSQLIEDPQKYKGQIVYLGGTILGTINTAVGTQIEILQKPLDRNNKPRKTDDSEGRFIIRHPNYLDPAIYSTGRDIVVVGQVAGTKSKPLGEIEYNYVLIDVKEMQLIEQESQSAKPSIGIGLGIGL
jgi:outer membrane lipoprotein